MDEITIIGAGPAGLIAALQLARYGLPATLIEKEKIGGLLWNANQVENYPGFPRGVSGPKLARLFEKQLQTFDVAITFDEVQHIELRGERYLIETRGENRESKVLVIASGTKPKPIPIPIPEESRDCVFSEVYPLLNTYNKQIAIIGAGDAAFDYALNLAKKGNSVTILNRGQAVKCLSLLRQRVAAEPSVLYLDGIALNQVEARATDGRLILRCEQFGRSQMLKSDYLLFAVGREPEIGYLSHNILEEKDQLIRNGKLYFIGDVVNGLMRQTAIAVGDGLRAAMQIYFDYRRLEK